ncbi:MAG: Ig-like domain-containing protein [Bacteroidales bacterium]|nr:Ig-like domain-containing protein [Bacteroidales bacterium]
MKRAFAICTLAAVILAGATSCEKKFNNSKSESASLYVYTKSGVDVGEEQATLHGELTVYAGDIDNLWEKIGFEWGSDPNLNSYDTVYANDAEGEGDDTSQWKGFRSNIFGLTPATVYYYRAFFIREGKRERGKILSFKTLSRKVTSILITPASYTLKLGSEETVQLTASVYPSDASDLSVKWSSDNPSIASVSETGLVTAKMSGLARIMAKSVLTPNVYEECEITVNAAPEPPPEGSVDMGLPSKVLWRDRNLGASSPSGTGTYYAWAETSGKASYTTGNYFWAQESGWDYPSRYSGNGSWGNGGDKMWFLKDKNYEDDAARQSLGGSWRVPSGAEFTELKNNCTITAVSGGFKFKAKNPDKNGNYNELFFPFNGRIDGTTSGYESGDDYYGESQCYFWIDELTYYTSGSQYYYVYAYAEHIYKTSSGESLTEYKRIPRCYGIQIRPVCN